MSRLQKISGYAFVVLTFALLLYRITLHADINDEIMNLSIAYRMIKGDIPFYHIQESYQLGAVFLVPFLWVYVKLTGGTTGIVLYSRVIYIAMLVLCAYLTYRLLKHYLKKDLAFFISYTIIFFQLFCMFYLWYDTEAVIFLLLGDLALVWALEQGNTKRQQYLFLMLSGVLHTCMAVAHVATIPVALGIAMILFALVYFQYGKQIVKALTCVLSYAAVPIVLVLCILLFLLVTGHLGEGVAFLTELIEGRLQIEFNLLEIVLRVKDTYMGLNSYLVQLTKLLLPLYVMVWFFPKLFPVLAFGVVGLSIINQFLMLHTSTKGLPNYIAYVALWAPLFYLLLKKKEKMDRCMFYLFVLPIFISAVFIPLFSMTSDYGPIKAWQMFLPGMIATLYFIARVWKEKIGEATICSCKIFYVLVSLSLLYNAYSFVYLCYPMITWEDTRLTEGIYAGIKVNESMTCMVDMQNMVERYTDGCETILASSGIRTIYLMTDLKPCTATTEFAATGGGEDRHWNRQLEYFKRFQAYPDIMFLEAYDLGDEGFTELKDQKYDFIEMEEIGEHQIFIYKKKA